LNSKLGITFENRRRDVISLNQPRGMSAKITANGITYSSIKVTAILKRQDGFKKRNYITCFGHICNHPHDQENRTQK